MITINKCYHKTYNFSNKVFNIEKFLIIQIVINTVIVNSISNNILSHHPNIACVIRFLKIGFFVSFEPNLSLNLQVFFRSLYNIGIRNFNAILRLKRSQYRTNMTGFSGYYCLFLYL